MLKKLNRFFTKNKKGTDNKTDDIVFQNKKLNFALEVGNIGVWDYDIKNNKTIFSKESASILGFSPEYLKSKPDFWNNSVHPEDRVEYFASFENHLEQKNSIYENISRIKNKNGAYQWVLDKGKVFEWSNDKTPKRIVGVHVDITDTKTKDEKISESLSLISKQNKKLKNFAHIASHNLKEHAGNFESLLKLYSEADTEVEKEEIINLINSVSKSLNNTIQNLRDIVSIESKKNDTIKTIEAKAFIDECVINLQTSILDKNATVHNNVEPGLQIRFNPIYFESIIQNLLTNAIKYKHSERNPIILIEGFKHEDGIQLSFQDNGIGIDLKTHGKSLFGLYKTFHKNKDAEGVGLYITKNQMEALGGSISVESEVNAGSKFILKFKN